MKVIRRAIALAAIFSSTQTLAETPDEMLASLVVS